MPIKKTSSQRIDESLAKSVNFEVTMADIAKRSERRAWLVAMTAIAVAMILIGGYFYMLPLKEKVPYVVMADAYTGTSSIARLTDDFTNQHITTNEAINRSNVAHFVLARESYDLATINLNDWATVLTMAAPNVASGYRSWVSPTNPDGAYKNYGNSRSIRVKILSIVLMGGGPNQTPKGATVRFQRNVFNNANGVSQPLDNKIATLMFTYKPDLQMSDQYRIENPLGFQVNDYRVDDDYDTPAPSEVPGDPASKPDAHGQPATDTGTSDRTASAAVAQPMASTQSDPVSEESPAPVSKNTVKGAGSP
ncbi:virB8 family protein [Dyella psychrodurans]|uniref:Type IV secretion system protein n=1 Tax=Dyella psychrodurans TaxID=1927960 RepID=A0A370X552_9GAMM|nr:type IV secretion system protein [Dyella psychrodurans]RDS83371.1 type IV secretion system protein [Dyella psychrodurans]